ncbi:hypothetical protein Glove_168g316 [Diversispora epigaea]|uniref:F-box domain-containing protein n=1 Tax=Diversispora epigaea TaxID=1348612 RepID=A0A397IPP9_9GLOM|nr:hypothetical protein Glove_168g316 [Diversispora epigaea]
MSYIQKNITSGPLAIPELLEKIFINLEYKDLYSCRTVNHQWSIEASRSLLKQKEKDLYENLNFTKGQLDWSKQETTRLHTIINTANYNWETGYDIKNVHIIVNSRITDLIKILPCLIKSSVLRNKFHSQWQDLYKKARTLEKKIDLLYDIYE